MSLAIHVSCHHDQIETEVSRMRGLKATKERPYANLRRTLSTSISSAHAPKSTWNRWTRSTTFCCRPEPQLFCKSLKMCVQSARRGGWWILVHVSAIVNSASVLAGWLLRICTRMCWHKFLLNITFPLHLAYYMSTSYITCYIFISSLREACQRDVSRSLLIYIIGLFWQRIINLLEASERDKDERLRRALPNPPLHLVSKETNLYLHTKLCVCVCMCVYIYITYIYTYILYIYTYHMYIVYICYIYIYITYIYVLYIYIYVHTYIQ